MDRDGWWLLGFVCWVVGCQAQGPPSGALTDGTLSTRTGEQAIVSGSAADLGPVVKIYRASDQRMAGTGTAIDSEHILTARHVLGEHDPSVFRISGSAEVPTAVFRPGPDYDIAILRVRHSNPVDTNWTTSRDEDTYFRFGREDIGKRATAYGYGLDFISTEDCSSTTLSQGDAALRQTTLRVRSTCMDASPSGCTLAPNAGTRYRRGSSLRRNRFQLCTDSRRFDDGRSIDGEYSAANCFDSGGPLYMDLYSRSDLSGPDPGVGPHARLVGVATRQIAFGDGGGSNHDISCWTAVHPFRDWIACSIEAGSSCPFEAPRP